MTAAGSPLRIAMLGPFEVWRGDVPVPPGEWRTQKDLSVLKILLDARPRTVPAERLIDLVWPDADPDAARNSLQVAIRTIRAVLEPELRLGRASRFVVTAPGSYVWAAAAANADIDVDHFVAARDRAVADARRGDLDAAIAAYTVASRVYRGDYLADDPYAEWAIAARERLHEQYLDGVERLAALLTQRLRIDEAIAWIERALTLDPVREGLYAALMRAHLAAGRRAHALVAYERAERVLRAELGTAPDAELQGLRDGRAVPSRGVPVPVATGRPATGRAAIPFVGRSRELDRLREAWAASRSAPGVVVAVRGTAGMGKTRLLREFVRSLGADARVLWLFAPEATPTAGLAPFTEALAQWRESATLVQRQRLADLRPLLAAGSAAERYEGLAQAARVVIGGAGGLVVFDDAHWADAEAIAALGYVSRRLGAGTLVPLAVRSDEPETGAIASLIEVARAEGQLYEVHPGSFGREDVATLAGAWWGEVATGTVERVFSATRGHPLFVAETLRALAAGGADRDLPSSVREAIASRVRRLTDLERNVLGVASVGGGPFRSELVARVLGRDAGEVLDALDVLLAHELVAAAEDGRGYVVAHPVVLRAVYEGLAPGRRLEWHRCLADELAGQRAGMAHVDEGERLRHLVAADAPWPEVAEATILAADRALVRHAYADAARVLESGRDALVPRLPRPDMARPLAEIVERLGDAFVGLARWDDAVASYEVALATEGRSRLDRARLMRKIGSALGGDRGRLADAFDALDRAVSELSGAEPHEASAEIVRIEAARATAAYNASAYEDAVRATARTLELAGSATGVGADVVEALIHGSLASFRMGDPALSDRWARNALARARAIGDRLREAKVLTRAVATVRMRGGRPREALDAFEAGNAIGRRLGVPANDVSDLMTHAMYLIPLGEQARARSLLEEALARAEAMGSHQQVVFGSVVLGRVLYELGRLAEARRALERGVALAEQVRHLERAAFGLAFLSHVAIAEGRPDEAIAHARRAAELSAGTNDTLARSAPLNALARAYLARGEAAAAIEPARRALAIAQHAGFRRAEASFLLTVAEAAWATRDRESGERHLAEADALRGSMDAHARVRSLLLRARTLDAQRPRRRERDLREAAALARSIGASILAREAAEALRT